MFPPVPGPGELSRSANRRSSAATAVMTLASTIARSHPSFSGPAGPARSRAELPPMSSISSGTRTGRRGTRQIAKHASTLTVVLFFQRGRDVIAERGRYLGCCVDDAGEPGDRGDR